MESRRWLLLREPERRRVRTCVTDDGLSTRAELGTRRVRWDDLVVIETDHPGSWATAVLARTEDGSTVRLRGVRPQEVDEVRAAWRAAVGP